MITENSVDERKDFRRSTRLSDSTSSEVVIADLKPTSEQAEVLACQEPRFSVVAAAGSGKTWVLVQRYVKYVKDLGLHPSSILTITFTRKAAAEMRTRIISSLKAEGLLDAAQAAELGPISTIQSFYATMLRENALEAGIDPEFEFLSESLKDPLLLGSIRETLSLPSDELTQEAQEIIEFLTGKSSRGNLYRKLEEKIRTTIDRFRGSGIDRKQLEESHQSPEKILRLWQTTLLESTSEAVQAELLPLVGTDLFAAKAKKVFETKVHGKMPPWVNAFSDQVEKRSARHTCGLVFLAVDAWKRYEQAMNRMQQFDQDELERRSVSLLENSEETRRRVQTKYKALLVDESQDLNSNQYRLLDGLGIANRMLVGDSNQAIYGFRHADHRLFELHQQGEATLRLTKNLRSEEAVLRFVDVMGFAAWGEKYSPMAKAMVFDLEQPLLVPPSFDGVELWSLSKETSMRRTADYIQQIIGRGETPGDIAVLVKKNEDGEKLQNHLGELGIHTEVLGGTQKIFTRLEVRDIANTLRALADRTDHFSFLCMLRSPVCNMSMDATIEFARNKEQMHHLDEVEFESEDDQRSFQIFRDWFLPLQMYADRLPAWEVISEIFAKSPYLKTLAKRPRSEESLANVRKLLRLAAKEPSMGPLEFAEHVRDTEQFRHRIAGAADPHGAPDAVKISTVHSSKGLEFPVVVLAETFDKMNNVRSEDLEIDVHKGVLVDEGPEKAKPTLFTHIYKSREVAQREEAMRLLYVALTRAQRRLIVVVDKTQGQESVAGFIWNLYKSNRLSGITVIEPDVSETASRSQP